MTWGACSSPSGPLFLESPPKKLSEAEKACADFSTYDHKEEYLISASKNHPRAEKFTELLLKLEVLDSKLFEYLSESDRFVYTLLLPSNEAVESFYQKYKPATLTGDQISRIVKMHIVIEKVGYWHFFLGQPLASTMANHILRFKPDESGCIVINEQASFLTVDDSVRNGVIHEISEVIIPDGGL